MDDLTLLRHYMKPYYQEGTPEEDAFLQAYLDEYTYPECAASALWGEKAGELAFEEEGYTKISTGAEKFEKVAPSSMQDTAMKQSEYYAQRCREKNGSGSSAIRLTKPSVGGVTEEFR